MFCRVVAQKAASVSVLRSNWHSLKQRADFLRLQQTGQKWVTPAFIVQCIHSDTPDLPRVGLTVTKKMGGAVVRNRIRRRLRAVMDRVAANNRVPQGWQLVLIARSDAAIRDFDQLCRDAEWAIRRLSEPVKTDEAH